MRPLGSGGYGEVLLATQLELDRPVVIKLLTALDADQRRRFDDEARIAAALSDPHVVRVIEHGAGETPWIAFELVEGGSLRAQLASGPLAPATVVQIGLQMCQALEAAHGARILHRDVKPDNILQATPELWKLTDFGISRCDSANRIATENGLVLGTPAYLAPEVIRGETGDARQDLYALGITLYELLAGHPPFEHENLVRVVEMQLSASPPPLRERATVSRGLEQLIHRSIAKDRSERFASAAQMREALRQVDPAAPRRVAPTQPVAVVAPRRRAPLIAAAALAMGAFGATRWTARPPPPPPSPSATVAADPVPAVARRLAAFSPAEVANMSVVEIDQLLDALGSLQHVERRLPLPQPLATRLAARLVEAAAVLPAALEKLVAPYRAKDLITTLGVRREVGARLEDRADYFNRCVAKDPAGAAQLRAQFRARSAQRIRWMRAFLALDTDLYEGEVVGANIVWELSLSGMVGGRKEPWDEVRAAEDGRPPHWMTDYMRAYLAAAEGNEKAACQYAERALRDAGTDRLGEPARAAPTVNALVGNLRELAPHRGPEFWRALDEGRRLAARLPPGAKFDDSVRALLDYKKP